MIYHAWGYDGVKLFADALARSSFTRESVRTELANGKGYDGALGIISFTPEGSWKMNVKMFQVKQGKLTPVT